MRDQVIFDFVSSFHFKENDLCSQRAHVFQALQRVKNIKTDEAFVEVGVFKGEVSRCIASFFKKYGYNSPMYLYDTFEGMLPEDATDHDWKFKHGKDFGLKAVQESLMAQKAKGRGSSWVRGSLEEVKQNVLSAGYDKVTFVKGPVQETLTTLDNIPSKIKFLWLDVDWYLPSLAAIKGFYPHLVNNGYIFFENINTWQGEVIAYEELRASGFLQESLDKDTQLLKRNKYEQQQQQ